MPASRYAVGFNRPLRPSLCVGQQIKIDGWLSKGRGAVLLPVTGPDRITISARTGLVSPATIVPGSFSAPFSFFYTAKKAGPDTVVVKVEDVVGTPDAVARLPLKVSTTCEHFFLLEGNLTFESREEPVAFEVQVGATGFLKSENPAHPERLTAEADITITARWTKFEAPDCQMLTQVPGRARGRLRLEAEPELDGFALRVKMMHPKITGSIDNEMLCDGRPVGYSVPLEFGGGSPDRPYWIDKTLPSSGGLSSVKMDILQQAVDRLRPAGNASYRASLQLDQIPK